MLAGMLASGIAIPFPYMTHKNTRGLTPRRALPVAYTKILEWRAPRSQIEDWTTTSKALYPRVLRMVEKYVA